MGSYPTFSPLPRNRSRGPEAVYSLWHCPSKSPRELSARIYLNPHRLELRGIAPSGVRTFLPDPLSRTEAILRPSGIARSLMQVERDDKRSGAKNAHSNGDRRVPCSVLRDADRTTPDGTRNTQQVHSATAKSMS